MNERWKLVLAFIGGMVLASIGSDPTDYLFFTRASQGALSSAEQVWYWYFLPAFFYFGVFIFAYLSAKKGWLKPTDVVYIIMGLVVWGAVQSLGILGGGFTVQGGVILAMLVSLGVLWGVKKRVED